VVDAQAVALGRGDVGPDRRQRAEVAATGLVGLVALVLALTGIGEIPRLLTGRPPTRGTLGPW